MASDPVHIARSRLARTVAKHGRESAEAHEAKRDLVAAKLLLDIASTLAASPPLTADQRQQIAGLLTGGAS